MSPPTSEPADERIRPPSTNIGTMTSMPWRIPQLSAIQPMNGNTSRPGSTQSEPIENPIDRARGGIAIDREASTPGPTIAKQRFIKPAVATAKTMLGDRANRAASPDDTTEVTAKKRSTRPGSLANRRVAMRAPMMSPISAMGSVAAAAMPRARSSRPNSCS